MNVIKTLTFACFLLFLQVISAQTTTTPLPDEANSSALGNANFADQAETLEHYIKNPIDINKAERGTLDELHILNANQINALLLHRINYGEYISLYELQSVHGFDLEIIRKILPYIKLSSNTLNTKSIKKILLGGEHTFIIFYEQPLQKVQGFLNGRDSNNTNDYLGMNFKTNIRYRYTNGSKFSIGINAANDIGEPVFNSAQKKGFDYYSMHLFVKDIGIIRQLVVGDYHLSIGQGLGIGSGFVLNKSIEVLQIHRYGAGLKPYRSLNEFGFFRGSAIHVGSEKISAILYASIKKTDGNTFISDTTIVTNERYYNLMQSGNHRTLKEIALKNTSTQKVFGGYVQTQLKNFHAGAGFLTNQTNAIHHVFHADLNYSTNNLSFFGEGALQNLNGIGLLFGMMASLHKNVDCALVYRNYNAAFNNSLSNAFSNASSPTNENGFYLGATFKLSTAFRFLCYADLFNSAQSKYRTNGPSHGSDYAFAIQYQPNKSFKLEMRYRGTANEQNVSASLEKTIGFLIQTERNTLRIQSDYSISKQLNVTTRFEQTQSADETGSRQLGNLIFQDIQYKSPKNKLGISFRYCLFNSNGSGARMYAFENDVPYSFSMVQLNGNGSRFYIMLSYKIIRSAELWIRYSNSFFPDATELGSGLDRIAGNTQESIKLLLKINL